MYKLDGADSINNQLWRFWYELKRLTGLNVQTDKNFFALNAACRLKRGILPPKVKITAAGRSDGIGMQALSRMSMIAFCEAFGATYIHTPFENIDHTPENEPEWAKKWEDFFGFNRYFEEVGAHHNIIAYPDYLSGKQELGENSVLKFQQGWWFTRKYPRSFRDVQTYFQPVPCVASQKREKLSIAVHIRRGDVQLDKNNLRYTSNSAVMNTVLAVAKILDASSLVYEFHIFSQGKAEDFPEFLQGDYRLHLNEDAILTMQGLVGSDVLLMSKSSFSYVAALAHKGVVVYEPTFNPAVEGWVHKRNDGSFDEDEFREKIATYLA